MMQMPQPKANQLSGFSHIEVLVATVLITISLLPAMDALKTGLLGSVIHRDSLVLHYHLHSKLAEILAQPITDLDDAAIDAGGSTVASNYSELAGTKNRRLVYLSRYDGDNADNDNDHFTGTDTNLIWVRVEVEGTEQAIETLITQTY